MVLHGFASRSSKSKVLRQKNWKQNQKSENETKNQKNNKDIVRLKNINSIEQNPINTVEKENLEESIQVDLDEDINGLISTENILGNEKDKLISTESQETNEDPRRKRRRSSASS